MDEPSVGLHPRDIDRLIGDHPVADRRGQHRRRRRARRGDDPRRRPRDRDRPRARAPAAATSSSRARSPQMLRDDRQHHGRLLLRPAQDRDPRQPPGRSAGATRSLEFRGATQAQPRRRSTSRFPSSRFVCLSGVSGSGKSTLLDNVIHQGLLAPPRQAGRRPGVHRVRARRDRDLRGRPRRPGARLADAALQPRALRRGLGPDPRALRRDRRRPGGRASAASSFSFNSGDGRCDHCQGLGYERVEMQFLSDVFVPCPVCEGRRFKPEVLAIEWNGTSVADLLEMSVTDALRLFAGLRADPAPALVPRLRRPRLPLARPAAQHPERRRVPAPEARALPGRRSTAAGRAPSSSSTSRRRASTATTSAGCSACSRRWSSAATAWSSSSTTWTC